jgi:protein-histidine pros-kinase
MQEQSVERPEAWESLRESETLLRKLFEYAPDAIVVVNRQGSIILVNAQTETMFGYSRIELLGQPVELLLPDRFKERHVMHRTSYMAEARVRPMGAGLDLFGRRKDGSEFPIDLMLSPLATAEGDIVTAIVRDITERKRFEQALQEKNIELAKANQAKDRFLASMSHELRTPLNAIIGFSGTLLMELAGPLTSEQQQQLQTIETSAEHLLSLINDLLDLAKIESGKVELMLEPVVCQSVIEIVAATLRPLAESKNLKLEVKTPQPALTLRTDQRALSQILLNLANNAIKFTRQGGVTIELAQLQTQGRRLTSISVIDTGPGIRPEDQARLFKAFEQLDSPHHAGGTGLGLYLSQKLANLLGGYIEFESEYGRGSRFTLVLPDG